MGAGRTATFPEGRRGQDGRYHSPFGHAPACRCSLHATLKLTCLVPFLLVLISILAHGGDLDHIPRVATPRGAAVDSFYRSSLPYRRWFALSCHSGGSSRWRPAYLHWVHFNLHLRQRAEPLGVAAGGQHGCCTTWPSGSLHPLCHAATFALLHGSPATLLAAAARRALAISQLTFSPFCTALVPFPPALSPRHAASWPANSGTPVAFLAFPHPPLAAPALCSMLCFFALSLFLPVHDTCKQAQKEGGPFTAVRQDTCCRPSLLAQTSGTTLATPGHSFGSATTR